MSKGIKLSVGLIVKNEERNLEKCLIALQPLLKGIPSELIIADTGSTDNTKEISTRYTDQVYDFEWCDDFSQARNFVLEKAQGEWFLAIDADEWLDCSGLIIDFLNSGETSAYNDVRIIVRNYHTYSGNKYSDDYVKRLFKRLPGRKFEGIVHESVPEIGSVKYIDAYLYHYGYVLDEKKFGVSKKSSRNTPLLLKELEKTPDNLQIMHQLVQEYAVQNDIGALEKICGQILYKYGSKKDNYYVINTCWYLNEVYKQRRDFEKIVKSAEPYITRNDGCNIKVVDVIAQALDALFELKNFKKAKKLYKIFFEMINECQDRSRKGEIGFGAGVLSLKEEAIEKRKYYYSYILFQCMEYKESFLYMKRIKGLHEDEMLANHARLWHDILNETKQYGEIRDYYFKIQKDNETVIEYIEKLIIYIWNNDKEMGKKIAFQLIDSDREDNFTKLLKLFLMYENHELVESRQIQELLTTVPPRIDYYRLLYIAIECGESIDSLLSRCTYNEVYTYARCIGLDCQDIREKIIKTEGKSKKESLFYSKTQEYLLLDVHLTDKEKEELFISYIHGMENNLRNIYKEDLLTIPECENLPDEHCFVVYILAAQTSAEKGDIRKSLRLYKRALKMRSEFSCIIKNRVNQLENKAVEQIEAKNQFDDYGKKIKIIIRSMIASGSKEAAREALTAYEKVNPSDEEINELKQEIGLS